MVEGAFADHPIEGAGLERKVLADCLPQGYLFAAVGNAFFAVVEHYSRRFDADQPASPFCYLYGIHGSPAAYIQHPVPVFRSYHIYSSCYHSIEQEYKVGGDLLGHHMAVVPLQIYLSLRLFGWAHFFAEAAGILYFA